MKLTPPPGDSASVATHHSNLIRRDFDSRRNSSLSKGASSGSVAATQPRARPLPEQNRAASTPHHDAPPQLNSTVALLALLFGRR